MNRGSQTEGGAVRKRQKIEDSGRQMFIWVAAMSAVVGLALVVSWSLWKQIDFRSDVIGEKNKTYDTLVKNNEAAPQLRDNLRVLETNTALADAKAEDDQRALQVVLDALPAEGNSLALGASLQQRLSQGISGLTIESLVVSPSSEEQQQDEESMAAMDEDGNTTANRIEFRMNVSASGVNALDELLRRLERSIRVIDVERLTMERTQQQYTMTISAHGYYQPAQHIELGSKVVRP